MRCRNTTDCLPSCVPGYRRRSCPGAHNPCAAPLKRLFDAPKTGLWPWQSWTACRSVGSPKTHTTFGARIIPQLWLHRTICDAHPGQTSRGISGTSKAALFNRLIDWRRPFPGAYGQFRFRLGRGSRPILRLFSLPRSELRHSHHFGGIQWVRQVPLGDFPGVNPCFSRHYSASQAKIGTRHGSDPPLTRESSDAAGASRSSSATRYRTTVPPIRPRHRTVLRSERYGRMRRAPDIRSQAWRVFRIAAISSSGHLLRPGCSR